MSEPRRNVSAVARELIARRSENPPGEEAAVAEWIADWLERSPVEFDVTVDQVAPGRPNVVASAGDPAVGTVVLNGHTDVVPADPSGWTDDPYEPTVRNGHLVGRGSVDMKGAIAAMMIAAERVVSERDDPPGVVLAFVVDEEDGGTGAARAVESGVAADADLVVVGEPTSLNVCTAIKGVSRYTVRVEGEGCHSGQPDQGRDAVRGVAELVDRIAALDETLEATDHPVLTSEDVTVTELDAGLAPNVVAPDATATVDWRFLPGQTDPEAFDERLAERTATLRAGGQRFDSTIERTVFARAAQTDPSHPAVRTAVEAVREAGADGEIVGFDAATDARFFVHDAGAPTIHFGPGSLAEEAHTVDESVSVAALRTAVDGYERILERFA